MQAKLHHVIIHFDMVYVMENLQVGVQNFNTFFT